MIFCGRSSERRAVTDFFCEQKTYYFCLHFNREPLKGASLLTFFVSRILLTKTGFSPHSVNRCYLYGMILYLFVIGFADDLARTYYSRLHYANVYKMFFFLGGGGYKGERGGGRCAFACVGSRGGHGGKRKTALVRRLNSTR